MKAVRVNEEWWIEHGGAEWRQELERRREFQPHYAQQEAFLASFFQSVAPARVLEFGCGFGRHLKYLRQIEGLEVFGCDVSSKMLEEAARYVGDSEYITRNTKLLEGFSLPYPDHFFDFAFTSEVLIHVAPENIPAILTELRRVTRRMVVHVENVRCLGGRRENDEHQGCWLHDFEAAWASIGVNDVEVFSGVIDRQDIYSAPLGQSSTALRGEVLRAAARVLRAGGSNEASFAACLQRAARAETQALEAQRLSSSRLERIRELEDAVASYQSSISFKAVSKARGLVPGFEVVRRAARRALGGAQRPAALTAAPVDSNPALPFGGCASRASEPTPEAFLALRPETVCLCHPDWRGIRAATYGQGAPVLEVPGICSQEHMSRLVGFLEEAGCRNLVINGVPPGMLALPAEIRRRLQGVRVFFVFHGSTAQHVTSPDEAVLLDGLASLAAAGLVEKLGFVKRGMAEYFRRLGVPAATLMNSIRIPELPSGPKRQSDGATHVGVFAPNLWHKNINTQLAAASLIPGAVVHVNEMPASPYLRRSSARFVTHGPLPHDEFLALLGRMDANLYVSLTECFPMTVLESLAVGVPCLTSHTSALFDSDPELFRAFVVTAHDSPQAISERLEDVLAHRAELVEASREHVRKLNAQARDAWQEFLA